MYHYLLRKKIIDPFSLRLTPVIFILCILIYLWFSLNRFIAWDEGFYVIAGKLILEGKLPYRDFFYPQMPLLPYIYACWFGVVGTGWYETRIITGIFAGSGVFLVWQIIHKRFGKSAGLLGLWLMFCSHFSFAWSTTAKAYGITMMLILLSYIFSTSKNINKKKIFISGLFLGLAVNTRLYVVALAIVPLISWAFNDSKDFISRITWYGLGFLIGLLPGIIFLLLYPEQFWFNNIGYHLTRSKASLNRAIKVKEFMALKLFSFSKTKQFYGMEFLLLTFFSILSIFKKNNSALWYGLILFLVSFTPTPTYLQYFCLAVPFLVIATVNYISELSNQTIKKTIVTYLILIFTLFGYHNINKFCFSGFGVPGIKSIERASEQTLYQVNYITKLIGNLPINSNEYIYSYWPGYLLESSLKIYIGTENHFGFNAAKNQSPIFKDKMRIIDNKDLLKALTNKNIKVAIVTERALTEKYADLISSKRYYKAIHKFASVILVRE
jgi:hypothetical protein